MKKQFLRLFDRTNRWWTVSYIVAGVLLIIASDIVTISDNPPGIALLYCGVIFLFLAFVHPWRKASSFGTLAGICAGIIALTFVILSIAAPYMTPKDPASTPGGSGYLEAFVMILILFICAPGILVGIIGAVYYSIKKK